MKTSTEKSVGPQDADHSVVHTQKGEASADPWTTESVTKTLVMAGQLDMAG